MKQKDAPDRRAAEDALAWQGRLKARLKGLLDRLGGSGRAASHGEDSASNAAPSRTLLPGRSGEEGPADLAQRARQLGRIQNVFFFLLVVLITLAFVWLVRDFLQPVFWAALLAVLFQPVYQASLRLTRGREAVSSLMSISSIVLVVLIPLLLVGLAVVQESMGLYQKIASGQIDVQKPIRLLESSLPLAAEYLEKLGLELQKIKQWLSSAAVNTSQLAASHLMSFGQNALRFAVLTLIMLYLLYFFFKDGERLISAVGRAIPLGDERERNLFIRFAEVSRATMKGTFVVGLVQGSLGGLLFWLLGIEAAIFWGVIMVLLSFLPVLGSSIIWAPAGLILLVTGSPFKGLFLLAAGTGIISLADNLLRPRLVGRETRLPDFLVLLATLGGLTLFGISGFVIGPVLAALFLTVWEMFGQEFGCEEDLAGKLFQEEGTGSEGQGQAEPSPEGEPDQLPEGS